MRDQRTSMGMPVVIDIVDGNSTMQDIDDLFNYFEHIEQIFSPYRETSETCRINRNEILPKNYSDEMKEILTLAEKTKRETNGFFDIEIIPGKINPVGIVKGWAIYNAAKILEKKGFKNFYVDIGGDIQTSGLNHENKKWQIGIRNPFNHEIGQELIKVVYLSGEGIATSGNYLRGNHIYNPFNQNEKLDHSISFSVIGPNVYEADRFATAAFAMDKKGIYFIEKLSGFEGYAVDKHGQATMTSNFELYTK
ncbi:MAG: hypothetical protein ACD_72C00101G0004 [uncultured bacterium]|nr:MAG: hypothetical protein ACD_72C00101G0004 [uncultured bacterium]